MNNPKFKQLSLNLCLKDAATFSNFFVGPNNQLVDVLGSLHINNEINFVYFWGSAGAGKSHLLNALCQLFDENGLSTFYLPLEETEQLNPQMLDNLEELDLICIDNINLIAKNNAWEEKLFHCFNNTIEHNKNIVITANASPQSLTLGLSDLKSRMASGLIFELHALSDVEKMAGLKLRAKLRGLELDDLAAQFLLHHYSRDTKNLFETLDILDKAALTAQRKLTIPFIKNILG